MSHLVVSAAQLKAEDGLLVFTLEKDIAFKSIAQVDGVCERGDLAGLVNSRSSAGDETKVLGIIAVSFPIDAISSGIKVI
jgi:hypothetical protein